MNLCDVIGPVMIGPSSSHTAGAARIGRVARQLLGEEVAKAQVDLHGSFAKTWEGHGTDRAVVGGLLGMPVDDQRLRDSRQIAREKGMEVTFRAVEIRDAHPNTMVLHLTGVHGGRVTVQAASVGGGQIRVQYLDGLEVGFSGNRTTLVIRHRDKPGVIADVSRVLSDRNINIATMRVFREEAGGRAVMALEMDDVPDRDVLCALRAVHDVEKATLLEKL